MNCDWKTIGEIVFSLYGEMEYRYESPGYTVERFKTDLEIEKKRELALRFPTDEIGLVEGINNAHWILQFRVVLESRRSILTKLFGFGNYLNGVDVLVEYCDYYIKDCFNHEIFTYNVSRIIRFIYKFIAANKTTGTELCDDVWSMLVKDMRDNAVLLGSKINDFPDYRFGATGIVVMADSDLNAVVQALIRSQNSFFGVSRVLVQEPVKEKLLNKIEDREYEKEILAKLFVFRNVPEALIGLNNYKELTAVSVWSENIIAAKKFAADIEIGAIWINTHGDLSPGFRSIVHSLSFFEKEFDIYRDVEERDGSSETRLEIMRTVNLFYGGKWELPTGGEYWKNKSGVSFAQATEKDIYKCVITALRAFKQWRSTKLSQRMKVIKCFAERLRAHGYRNNMQSEYADEILQWANTQLLECGNSLSIARDGDAEITSTSSPVGLIVIASKDQAKLFKKLTIATLTGNTVILAMNSQDSKVSFAPYCEMLASCGFPPGVINCLFSTNKEFISKLDESIVDGVLGCNTDFLIEFHQVLHFVTKLKSVWLDCT